MKQQRWREEQQPGRERAVSPQLIPPARNSHSLSLTLFLSLSLSLPLFLFLWLLWRSENRCLGEGIGEAALLMLICAFKPRLGRCVRGPGQSDALEEGSHMGLGWREKWEGGREGEGRGERFRRGRGGIGSGGGGGRESSA